MELTKFITVCLVFILSCDFVYGTKEGLEPLVRHRRGHEPTKVPLTTLLPVINVNQQDVKAVPNNLNFKIHKIEPTNPIKGVITGSVIKKIGTTATTPVLILYTTRKPMSTRPMVIFKRNNEMVTKAHKAETEAVEHNDTNSNQTNNEIKHELIKTAVPADSKNTLQTICLEEHTQKQLDDVHEGHIEKAGKEKKEAIKHTTYHVSDKNGKKITEITTTKIIEENCDNAATKQHSHEKCDILDLTDEHSLMKHMSEVNIKDKSVIAINESSNGTNVSNNLGFTQLTTNHIDEHSLEINPDSKNLNTHFLDGNPHDIKQENISHEIDSDTKNQTTHLLPLKLEYTKPLDNKIMDDVKECNITQQLEKKDEETHLPQTHSDKIEHKDNQPNITIKLLAEIAKSDVIKLTNVSSIDLKPSLTNVTTKPVASNLSINAVKEVLKVPIIQKLNTLLVSNAHKPQVTIVPTKAILKIDNTTDCNTTKVSNNNKPKDLDLQRMKMSIKVEMNPENKSVPVDCKNTVTAPVVHKENGPNGTYTNVNIKLDDQRNDTKETITIHRNNIEEIVDHYKYPFANNLCDNSAYNRNENYIANNNYLVNSPNLDTGSTSPNNFITDCTNYVVNGNYVPENSIQYYNNYATNAAYNNYDKYQQVSNPNDNIQGNLYQEQTPNNCYSNYLNGQYYSTYQNVMPSASSNQNYQNNYQTDNAYSNPNSYYLQNYKPNTYRADNLYYNTYNSGKYNYVNNLNCNKNKPTKNYNYKEQYIPGRYHDRIWRTWNNMDIIVNNKGAPLKIEFGKDDKNTIHLYNTVKNNNNQYISHKKQ